MSLGRSSAAPWLAVALAAATLVSTAACDESPTGPSIRVGADVTLAPGSRARVADTSLTLQFDGVDGDSRCPGDAICITGGDALVKVTVIDGSAADRHIELHTGSLAPVRHGRYVITLIELSPYPFSSRPFSPGDYRATLRVTAS